MALLGRWRSWRKARTRARTERDIHDALDRVYRDAGQRDLRATEPMVIFSDQHKGARDGADDFLRCERTYNAALAYYHRLGWHLVELGDVEELWENSFNDVAACYSHTLELSAAFQRTGRYTRLWGNHDLAWSNVESFQKRMTEHSLGGVTPIEALRLAVSDAGGERLGELFLVHGHQGTADSDRYAFASRLFVRFGWRRLQRLLNRPWNTPSVDWALRGEHAGQMAAWASARKRVLIAGHTHLPVFFGEEKQPEAAVGTPSDPDPERAEALRLAWAEWARAEQVRLVHQRPTPLTTPCYFNTGCCSFGDGDITGLEISDGEIRLVRWPCDAETDREPLGDPLALSEVFRLTA